MPFQREISLASACIGVPLAGAFFLCFSTLLSTSRAHVAEPSSCVEHWYDAPLNQSNEPGITPSTTRACESSDGDERTPDTGYREADGRLYWYWTERDVLSQCPDITNRALHTLLKPVCHLVDRSKARRTREVRQFWQATEGMPRIYSSQHSLYYWSTFCKGLDACISAPLPVPSMVDEALPSSRFTHFRWSLTCDNEKTCSATGASGDNRHNVALLLTRRAGAWEPVRAKVRFLAWATSKPQQVRFSVNHQEHGILTGPDQHGDYTFSAAQLRALLTSLATGHNETLFTNSDGTRWPLSGRGATATLLKMDDVQGRLHTPGALVRKGWRSEHRVPVAPSIPTLRPATRFWLGGDDSLPTSPDLLHSLSIKPELKHCHAAEEDLKLSVDRLSADRILVSTQCTRRVYGGMHMLFWVANDTAPFMPKLLTIQGQSYRGGELLVKKSAPHDGDCATIERWRWTGERFRQASVLTTGLCADRRDVGSWEIPVATTRVIP